MKFPVTFLCLSFLLLGCSTLTPIAVPTKDAIASDQINPDQSQGQQLPIGATMQVGQETIELEVAATPEEQQMGLMYRTQLPENRGMVFEFSPPRVTRFWMKNTLIPLDMIFVYQGKIKAISANVPPCKLDPCPVYGPLTDIEQVVELPAGRAKTLNLSVGDRLLIDPVKSP